MGFGCVEGAEEVETIWIFALCSVAFACSVEGLGVVGEIVAVVKPNSDFYALPTLRSIAPNKDHAPIYKNTTM